MASAGGVAGTVFTVSTRDELEAALENATGGDTVSLALGEYGELQLIPWKTSGIDAVYESPVSIVSADGSDPASFSGIDLRGVSNLTFEKVRFDYEAGDGAAHSVRPFRIKDSSDIAIRDSVFDGDLATGVGPAADGKGTGKGLSIGGSANITIEGNVFFDWHRAMVFGGIGNLTVVNNDIHSIRSDGMNFVAVNAVVIEGNHIHDFDRAHETGDHADMIQFWTTNTDVPSEDVVIRGNILDVGEGGRTQSIFMRNEMVDRGLAGEEMFYRNLRIEENVILNNHAHGITVGETDGLVIRHNSVLDGDASNDSGVATPRINVAAPSRNVTVAGNATAAINADGSKPGWQVSGNAIVQNTDPAAPGYYESEFVSSSMSGEATGYIVDPEGSIARLEAGAGRLRRDTAPETLRPAFDVASVPAAAGALVFDATHSHGPAGAVTAGDATFRWDFGDGATATGRVVRHGYEAPGTYSVTLTVTRPDGTAATAEAPVRVAGVDVLSYNPGTGFFMAEGYGQADAIEGSDSGSIRTGTGHGVDLGAAEAVQVSIPEEEIARLFGADSVEMAMTLRADRPGSTGEVARVHGNLVLGVAARGEIDLRLWTERGVAELTTTGVTVNDGADHDIRIVRDSAPGKTQWPLQIHVDGQLAGATRIEGAMRSDYPRDLIFGNPWGKENFDGTLTAFDLDVPASAYPAFGGDLSTIAGDPGTDGGEGGDGRPAPVPRPGDAAVTFDGVR